MRVQAHTPHMHKYTYTPYKKEHLITYKSQILRPQELNRSDKLALSKEENGTNFQVKHKVGSCSWGQALQDALGCLYNKTFCILSLVWNVHFNSACRWLQKNKALVAIKRSNLRKGDNPLWTFFSFCKDSIVYGKTREDWKATGVQTTCGWKKSMK